MKRIRNLVLIVVGLAIVIAVAALAGRRSDSAVAVSTTTVHRGTFQIKLPENGVVQHPRTATVPTLVAGNLGQIYVKPGDAVGAGALLATVRNPQLESAAASSEADYNSASADVQTARINVENAQVTYQAGVDTAKSNLDEARRIYRADVTLYANKAIPRNQLDADKAKLDQMQVAYDQAVRQLKLGAVTSFGQNSVQAARAAANKAAIANAENQQQLAFTQITAPFSGVIQSVATQPNDPLTPLHPGDPVTAGQALFTIASSNDYVVQAQVDEQDVINVHPGQQVDVTGEDFPGVTIVGHVERIAPVAIKSTDTTSTARQVLTTIRLDRSPSFLKDGMTVNVDILTTNVAHALLVPTKAIVTDKGKKYVYAIRGNVARKTRIVTGQSNDTQTLVKLGLGAGDRIVAEPSADLHDGARITVAPAASPKAT